MNEIQEMKRTHKFHNPNGLYFITFSVIHWIDVFTRKAYRDIVVESLAYCQKEKGLILYAWVIMSNHVHLIASTKEEMLLQDIMRDLKKFTSKKIIKEIRDNPQESRKEWMLRAFEKAGKLNENNKYVQFWQQKNHPIELWSNDVIEQKLNYLHQNPVKAGIVFNAEEYLYSSAIDYAGEKGLLEVILI